LATAGTVCAGSPVPFDAAEIDKKLAAAHTLNTLAKTTNRVVFDLYDHCALVVRFFIVESNGQPIPVDVRGDQALASNRSAHRSRAISSGEVEAVTLDRPARFHLVAAPLHDGDRVQGVLEFVIPSEMVEPKRDRLDFVSRATSAALRAWHTATVAQHETSQVAGASFALGVRLAGVVMEAGELGAAIWSAVQFLAKEFKTPVVSWRADPSGQVLRMGPSSGLGNSHRTALEAAASSAPLGSDRSASLRELGERVGSVFGVDATVVDGGPVVLVASGRQPELESCGRDLAGLLQRLPVSSVASVESPFAGEDLELARLRDLTPRESEILALLAGGSGTRQIARRLVISEKTVKTHIQNILRKLDAASRLEAAAMAIRAGYVPVSAS
jgi:DNA-binding CsgD family transcriptional regulator